jgi:hypothetical protein
MIYLLYYKTFANVTIYQHHNNNKKKDKKTEVTQRREMPRKVRKCDHAG